MDRPRRAIGEHPWGWTLGELGAAHRTVRVTLRADDAKEYRIRFDGGAVVEASSPLVVDSVARVALTNHFVARVQLDEIKRCLAAAPDLDEVDVLATAANLDPDRKAKLRTRLLVQRAARTFAVDRGDFEIEDCEAMPSAPASVDVHAVIFAGARMNLSEDRLRFGLRRFSTRFVMKPGVSAETLARFGFSPKEQVLLETLRGPTSLAELEAHHREVDARGVAAMVYALTSCGALTELALDLEAAPALDLDSWADSDLSIPVAAEEEPSQPTEVFEGPLTKAITSLELEQVVKYKEHFADPFSDDAPTSTLDAIPKPLPENTATTVPTDRSMIETFKTGKVTLVRANPLTAMEVVELIKERTAMIARGVDAFTLLGVPVGAPVEDIHAAYVELVRNLSAKRLRELRIVDKDLLADAILAQLLIAFTVLTDRVRRAEYMATMVATPSTSPKQLYDSTTVVRPKRK